MKFDFLENDAIKVSNTTKDGNFKLSAFSKVQSNTLKGCLVLSLFSLLNYDPKLLVLACVPNVYEVNLAFHV